MSYRYRKSHYGDKTVVRSSYLHNGISYTGKMTSSYWIRALFIFDTYPCSPATGTPVKYVNVIHKDLTVYIHKIRNIPEEEINQQSFSNPHLWHRVSPSILAWGSRWEGLGYFTVNYCPQPIWEHARISAVFWIKSALAEYPAQT